mmetsp:Transcript_32194/g.52019  ORF Transcript_32194/g.52019 Transcript_32194/m.52019 type:complete len:796 (+) Transcript_32194:76-2463(+)
MSDHFVATSSPDPFSSNSNLQYVALQQKDYMDSLIKQKDLELRQKTLELEDRNRLLVQARQAIEKMQAELESSKQERSRSNREARGMMSEQQGTIDNFRKIISEQQASLEALGRERQSENSSLREQVQELREELARREGAIEERQSLLQRISNMEGDVRSLEDEISETKRRLADTNMKLQRQTSLVTETQAQLAEKERLIREYESTLQRLEERAQGYEDAMQRAQQEATREKARMEDSLRNVKLELANKESSIKALFERERASWQKEKEELEERYAADADARVAAIQNRIQDLNTRESMMASQLAELLTDDKLKSERNRTVDLERRLQTEIRKFRQQLQAKNEEIDQLKQIHVTEKRAAEANVERRLYGEVKTQLDRQEEMRLSLEQRLVEAVKQKEEVERRAQRETNDLRLVLANISDQIAELKSQPRSSDMQVVNSDQYAGLWHSSLLDKLQILMKKVEKQMTIAKLGPDGSSSFVRDWKRSLHTLQRTKPLEALSQSLDEPDFSSLLSSDAHKGGRLRMGNMDAAWGVSNIPEDVIALKTIIRRSCQAAGISDATCLPLHVEKLAQLISSIPMFEKFADEVKELARQGLALQNDSAFGGKGKGDLRRSQRDNGPSIEDIKSVETLDDALSVLKSWAQQQKNLSDLTEMKRRIIRELRKRPASKERQHLDGHSSQLLSYELFTPSVIVNSVHELVIQERSYSIFRGAFRDAELRVQVQPELLIHRIVTMFQSLFEVRTLERVLPRMHDLYLQFNDFTLFIKVLRSMLKLDSHASTTECLSAIRNMLVEHLVHH